MQISTTEYSIIISYQIIKYQTLSDLDLKWSEQLALGMLMSSWRSAVHAISHLLKLKRIQSLAKTSIPKHRNKLGSKSLFSTFTYLYQVILSCSLGFLYGSYLHQLLHTFPQFDDWSSCHWSLNMPHEGFTPWNRKWSGHDDKYIEYTWI